MWDAINRMGGSSPMMGMGAFGGQVNPEQKYMEALQKYQNAPEEKKAEALAKLIIAIERLTEFQQNQGQPNILLPIR
jgi:hypothetical protein